MGDDSGLCAVRVMVVDDSADFRAVAIDVIEHTPGFESIGGAESAADALLQVEVAGAPDLMLVDVRMPGVDGIELTRQLQRAHGGVVVALVSAEPLVDLPSGALTSGAAKFIAKEELAPRLLLEVWATHGRSVVDR